MNSILVVPSLLIPSQLALMLVTNNKPHPTAAHGISFTGQHMRLKCFNTCLVHVTSPLHCYAAFLFDTGTFSWKCIWLHGRLLKAVDPDAKGTYRRKKGGWVRSVFKRSLFRYRLAVLAKFQRFQSVPQCKCSDSASKFIFHKYSTTRRHKPWSWQITVTY